MSWEFIPKNRPSSVKLGFIKNISLLIVLKLKTCVEPYRNSWITYLQCSNVPSQEHILVFKKQWEKKWSYTPSRWSLKIWSNFLQSSRMVYSWACRRNQCMYNYLRNTHFFLSNGFMNQSHHRIHVRCRQNWDNFLNDHTGLASTSTDRDCHWSTLRRRNNEEREDVYPCIIWQRPANLIQFSFKLINLLVNHGLDTRNACLDKSLQMLQTTTCSTSVLDITYTTGSCILQLGPS